MNSRYRYPMFTGLVLLGALFVACTTETTVVTSGREDTGISVSGSGSVFGEPDVAVLSLGVEAEADTVGEARSLAAGSMDAMLGALKDGGVADEDIQTQRFSVQPRFSFRNETRELEGFVVTNIVTAKIRDIDGTGDLIDGAVEAGGDLARVEALSFTIDDPAELQDEARREAMADARGKAETLAEAAGVDLGAPRTISESGSPQPIFFETSGLERAAAVDDQTPIETGELEVRIQVQIVYELEAD